MRVSRSISILITSINLLLALQFFSDARGQEGTREIIKADFRKQLIKKVVLKGVRSFDENDIKKLLFTKPNHWYNFLRKRRLSKTNVRYDDAVIVRFYGRRGFLFASASDSLAIEENNKASVYYMVSEGKRTYLSGAGVTGGSDEINIKFDDILDKFKIGEPINDNKVLAGRFALRDIYNNNGYPYARVDSRYEFSFDSTKAYLRYEVAESLFTISGQTRLAKTGYTHSKVIMRELVIKPGQPYKQKDVIESERRLLSTGLFKYLSLMRDDSNVRVSSDTCVVDYTLNYEERKRYLANIGAGIGQEVDFEVVWKMTGSWGIRNLGGTGRQLFVRPQLMWQITDPQGSLKNLGFSDLKRKLRLRFISSPIELNYIEPWLLNRRLPLTLKATWEPKTLNKRIPDFEYRYNRAALEAILINEIDRFTTARVSAATEYINILNVPPDQQEAFRAEGNNQIRRKISLYGERDTRDNFFVPQHGSYSFVGADYVGGILGGDFSYLKTQFSWSRYQILIGENILATRIWLGWLNDLGKKGRSSAEDRFMLGGATTVRGYSENSLGPVFVASDNPGEKLGKPKGGRYMMLGNIELRRPLFWRFGGAAFVDAGNTYSNLDYIKPLSVAFSSGIGIQFFTPVGPVRLDYGIRLKKAFDLGAGTVHLSILYAF